MNTTGLCMCGCGTPTKIARDTYVRRGEVAGQPRHYVRGHNRLTPGGDIADRFWRFVRKTDGCWYWTGRVERTGYGRFNLPGRRRELAHRMAYRLSVGEIPAGLTIDHLCMERTCVNPAHMEVVTRSENTRRARVAARGGDN